MRLLCGRHVATYKSAYSTVGNMDIWTLPFIYLMNELIFFSRSFLEMATESEFRASQLFTTIAQFIVYSFILGTAAMLS